MPRDPLPNPPLSGITFRELEVLRAVIENGTATTAAHRLGISQPAVSRMVAQMEKRLGRLLFLRKGGRLLPTAEAHAIDSELDGILAALARIEATAGPSPDPAVPLRIAAPPSMAHRFLPGPVADFARRHPDNQLFVDVVSSDVLVTHVAEGRVDLAITDTEPNHAGVRVQPFHVSDVVCLMRRDDPLAEHKEVTPTDLDGRDFVSLTRRHSARAANDGVLTAAKVHPRTQTEVATVVFAAELVREGLGVALINPFPTSLRLHPSLCLRPFWPRITLRTSFLTPAGMRLSAAALAFMDLVRAAAAVTNEEHTGDPEHPQP